MAKHLWETGRKAMLCGSLAIETALQLEGPQVERGRRIYLARLCRWKKGRKTRRPKASGRARMEAESRGPGVARKHLGVGSSDIRRESRGTMQR